ncbi:MAG: AAA family ATPase, partial [Kiritimatiellae bacterium]|nr:AAA family ATPase [Kiritimatiellia bacterium]
MIGRKKEIRELENAYAERESEFVAVYGRRRVGKTYLVRETFSERLAFQHAGLKDKPTAIQLDRFRQSLVESGFRECGVLKNWYKAFDALKTVISGSGLRKKVVFLDELQWMDRPNANFVSALENFWNGWASARKDVLLVVCGSASSWILRKIVYNKEGLHNRVTYRIPLRPFSLAECEAYAKDRGLEFTRRQLAELYMILGGVPYYWHFLERGKSVAQNIDEMFFAKSDKLENEFGELYASLFQSPEPYVRLVTALATKKAGMTRELLSATSGVPESGKMTQCLDDLDRCGFIRKYTPLGRSNRGAVYQLMDNFT